MKYILILLLLLRKIYIHIGERKRQGDSENGKAVESVSKDPYIHISGYVFSRGIEVVQRPSQDCKV